MFPVRRKGTHQQFEEVSMHCHSCSSLAAAAGTAFPEALLLDVEIPAWATTSIEAIELLHLLRA